MFYVTGETPRVQELWEEWGIPKHERVDVELRLPDDDDTVHWPRIEQGYIWPCAPQVGDTFDADGVPKQRFREQPDYDGPEIVQRKWRVTSRELVLAHGPHGCLLVLYLVPCGEMSAG